jgi:hypothetical protein
MLVSIISMSVPIITAAMTVRRTELEYLVYSGAAAGVVAGAVSINYFGVRVGRAFTLPP